MANSGELIRRRRHLVTIIVRLTCVVLIGTGAVGMLSVLGRALLWGGWRAATRDYSAVGFFSLSAACVIVGLVLAAVHGRLVKWLVPVMPPTCPNCGYALGKTRARVCSECGFPLERDE
jgi:hypothetical protein